jgi:hypothetical protein
MTASRSLRGRLGEFAGRWTGHNHLWLEPGTPAHECSTSASIALEARGACVSLRYAWEEGGAPQEGLLLVRNVLEVGAEDMVWVDSFHTGGQFMRFRGEADDAGRVSALGSYNVPPGPQWGWRIVLGSDAADGLHVLMYNIAPDGTVYPAVEARYARRAG